MNFFIFSQKDKIKNTGTLRGMYNHDSRIHPPANANPDKRFLNQWVMGSGERYDEEFKKIVKEKDISIRKGAVYALAYETSFAIRDGEAPNLSEWVEANKRFFCDYFGEENVLSMCLHLDESTPHIHTVIIPTEYKSRNFSGHERSGWNLNARKFTGGYSAMVNMYNEYAEYMKPFNLHRGNSKASKEDFKSVEQFYRAIHNVNAVKVPEKKKDEDEKEYLERAQQSVTDQTMGLFKALQDLRKKYHDDRLLSLNLKAIMDKLQEKISYEDTMLLLNKLCESSKEYLEQLLSVLKIKDKDTEKSEPIETETVYEDIPTEDLSL